MGHRKSWKSRRSSSRRSSPAVSPANNLTVIGNYTNKYTKINLHHLNNEHCEHMETFQYGKKQFVDKSVAFVPRRHSCIFFKGKLWLFGGDTGNCEPSNMLQVYDITENA